MAEDLQQLLDRINRDYLSKAEAEKDSLIAAAKAEASGILADARAASIPACPAPITAIPVFKSSL